MASKTALEIEGRANAALERVREWGVANKLRFAPHKTNAVVITRKLKYDTPHLSMGGVDVRGSKAIKLLGLTIDDKLTFNAHVSDVCRRAMVVYHQLKRAAKVTWGLHPEVIKTIYTATVEPIILYAASVWAPAVGKLGVQKHLKEIQRGFARKICKAYRTVSLNSALVLSGMLPLDLRIREAAALYETRRGVLGSALLDRETEKICPVTEIPHPAEQIGLEFKNLVDEEQLKENSGFDIRIFTDGSKIEGRVGAALSLWKGPAETKALKLTLPSYSTVYQAELLAICRAARETLRHNYTSFGIYSDSMAALQTITSLHSLHPLAVETRKHIKTAMLQNKLVSLFWI